MSEKLVMRVGLTESDNFLCLEDLQIQNFSGYNSVSLDYLGREQCEPGYAFGPYVRESFVLHMVVSGCGKLMKNGKTFEIGAGQAFLIYPRENTVYQADAKDPWKYMWIGFHGIHAEYMMGRAGFSKAAPVIECRNMEEMQTSMDRLLEFKEPTYVQELTRISVFYQLLAQISENVREDPEEMNDEEDLDYQYVQTAIQLFLKSLRDNVKISDVAKQIGISRNYLSSIFKQHTGVSPQEFVMSYRMREAASLLAFTTDPVHVIAVKVGYHDSLSFSKAFRNRFGLSPTEYREQRLELETHKEKGDYTSNYPL
ncbi:MAG: helix-turn-helix domain-containing protein [Blautia sp.]|nr:helix-turn-helix domain-containing protein [Blautia sp.]